ncbi:YhdH/YhfP family quinone oxidoreductase [Desertivirga arenae]|uniref:YhdH/YhfP family quinone oxidoreductase n=1 Tax=Desertivirga arenae TaxID=2810309 RepID=UPI001A95FE9B|nr:YhdH/YhfP family quinone oxidoreductase [Pedobacter sp. SYSU D00823]
MDTFKALLIEETEGGFSKQIKNIPISKLPQNDVLIRVQYSCINYKDALSASGNKGVTRTYPHVPGVDASGVVISSKDPSIQEGDEVLVTGFDLGMNTWGGFGEYISVPASWVLPLPENLSAEEAMCFGTAGLTAGLSVLKLVEGGIEPEAGEIVVSGATGGVGSLSVAILSKLGYKVTAISGKSEDPFLKEVLGVSTIISRQEFINIYNTKPLSKEHFAAGIDTVGGDILSGVLKATKYGGLVTCCGMVSSPALSTSIFPFILRGVQLAGIDSVVISRQLRQKVWNLLALDWKPQQLKNMVRIISIEELSEKLEQILEGNARGRYLLKH